MTPEEFARKQRADLIRSEKRAALLVIAEFEQLKSDISEYLKQTLPQQITPESLYQKNFLEKILAEIENRIEALTRPLAGIIARAQNTVIYSAADNLKRFLREKRLTLDAVIFDADKPAIKKLIGQTQNKTPLARALSDLKKPIREKAKAELIEGFSLGESPEQIAKRIKTTTDFARYRALMISRTEQNEAYRAASREFFQSAGLRYKWRSARDARTCAICWSLDGKIFDSDKKKFSHPNCRCVLLPYFPNEAQEETGAQKFAKLEAGWKKQILGNKRYELYKNENRALSSFIGEKQTEFGTVSIIKPL